MKKEKKQWFFLFLFSSTLDTVDEDYIIVSFTCREEIVSAALVLSDNASASWASKLSNCWGNKIQTEWNVNKVKIWWI